MACFKRRYLKSDLLEKIKWLHTNTSALCGNVVIVGYNYIRANSDCLHVRGELFFLDKLELIITKRKIHAATSLTNMQIDRKHWTISYLRHWFHAVITMNYLVSPWQWEVRYCWDVVSSVYCFRLGRNICYIESNSWFIHGT